MPNIARLLKEEIVRVARLEKLLAKGGSVAVESPPNEDAQLRFRADGFRKHCARRGISAPAMAGLLGGSAQTIYNWESGRSRPGKAQTAKIAVVREIGKRELGAKLGSSPLSYGDLLG